MDLIVLALDSKNRFTDDLITFLLTGVHKVEILEGNGRPPVLNVSGDTEWRCDEVNEEIQRKIAKSFDISRITFPVPFTEEALDTIHLLPLSRFNSYIQPTSDDQYVVLMISGVTQDDEIKVLDCKSFNQIFYFCFPPIYT